MLGKTSMAIMGVKGTLNPLLYSHRGLENFRVTARVVNGIIVFWKQVNYIMNNVIQWTILNIKDTSYLAR